jgi:hypothetical protein
MSFGFKEVSPALKALGLSQRLRGWTVANCGYPFELLQRVVFHGYLQSVSYRTLTPAF